MQNCRRSIDILIKKTIEWYEKYLGKKAINSGKKAINSGINVTAVEVQKCIAQWYVLTDFDIIVDTC